MRQALSVSQKPRLTLPTKVLIGALLGIVVGVFFGDDTKLLSPIGNIYIMLLQVVVYPYIICTLLRSLGSLTPKLALRLFRHGWPIYVLVLLVTFATMIILAIAIPISHESLGARLPGEVKIDLLNYIIPANLIEAIARNYVPAVVIFCVLFGIMLQHVNKTATFFSVLDTISATCLKFWRWLIKLAPISVFAILAHTAGTVRLDQLTALGEFLLLFFIGAMLLTFWLLPCIITSMTPIRYKPLLTELRSTLIIATATTLSVLALPLIRELTTKLIHGSKKPDSEAQSVINTSLMVSYPFAQLGNFFLYLFMLAASLYFDHSILHSHRWLLPIMTYLSSIGSPSTVVNAAAFLANWLHLPKETLMLYTSIMPIARYFQVLVSVMGLAFVTILVTYAYYRRLTIKPLKLLTHLSLAGAFLLICALGLKMLIPNPALKTYHRLNSFNIQPSLSQHVDAKIMPASYQMDTTRLRPNEDALHRIHRTGVIYVGYNTDVRPFMFYNTQRKLVGFDAAYAHMLAKTLNVKLRFVPFSWNNLVTQLESHQFDIAMSAIFVTSQRLKQANFTQPYFKSQPTFIVPKDNRAQFSTTASIKSIENLRIGVLDDPLFINLIKNQFQNAKLVILPKFTGYLAKAFSDNKIDAAIWGQAQARAWVLNQPDFVAESPKDSSPFLLAYMVHRDSPQFLLFLDYWLTLQENSGFRESVYNHWILVQPLAKTQPRWSILHNVLGW